VERLADALDQRTEIEGDNVQLDADGSEVLLYHGGHVLARLVSRVVISENSTAFPSRSRSTPLFETEAILCETCQRSFLVERMRETAKTWRARVRVPE
jgi:hypothetical protein